MKALSIRQPWADLLALGIKDVENRSRRTNYRGRILLHSSKVPVLKRNEHICSLLTNEQWHEVMRARECPRFLTHSSNNGCIIGEAEIVDCVNDSTSIWAEPGQWHWIIRNARMYKFDEIIPNVKGKLGLWDYDLKGGTK